MASHGHCNTISLYILEKKNYRKIKENIQTLKLKINEI